MPFRIGWPPSQPTPSGSQGGEGQSLLRYLINSISKLFSSHVKESKEVELTQFQVKREAIPPSAQRSASSTVLPTAKQVKARTAQSVIVKSLSLTLPQESASTPQGAALTTAQGPAAEAHAYKVNGCITAAIARQSDSALSTHGEREFIGCMNAIEEVIKKADLSDPKQCDFVNGLVQLVQKGFNVHSGGVGSLHHNDKWNNNWNHLGKTVKFEGGKDNAQVKTQVFQMLAFYKENAGAHFSEARHMGSRELAAAQVAATIGQLVQDFTHNEEFPLEIRNALFSQMRIQGLVDDKMTFKEINAIKNKMRGNPLLAEVKNASLKKDIGAALMVPKTKKEMVGLIKEELERQHISGNLDELAEKIYLNFQKKVDEMTLLWDKTGSRGRAPAGGQSPDWSKALGATLAGHEGESKSIAVAPHRANDPLSDKHVREALGDQPEIAAFDHAVHGEEQMLKRGAPPKTLLRLGKGLDTQFVNLLNPAKLFKEAAQEVVPNAKWDNAPFVEGYKRIVGNIEVTFNAVTKQKMALNEFASMKSVASVMRGNDLRTICSISGTTVDIILAKITTMGKEEVQKLMQPLLDHLEGKQPDPLGTPGTEEGKKFKQWVTSISLFMQAGNYHTAAEVLGGLFIAGRSLCCTDEENKEIGRTYELFEQLMTEFSQTPEKFFDVSPEDAAKINGHEKAFRKDLAQAEKERITRHEV